MIEAVENRAEVFDGLCTRKPDRRSRRSHHVRSLEAHNENMSTTSYQPGVCNIGPAERQQRLNIGWGGLAVTFAALAAFVIFQVADPWRLLVAIPAIIGATGFLQYRMHFCVNFAMRGLYNLGDKLGTEENVVDAEMRRADQRKGLQIIGLSLLAGAAVAIIAVLLP